MSRSRQRWQASLLALVMLGHVGCAARGGATVSSTADRPRLELHTTEPVSVVSGGEPVRVKRGTLLDAWTQDTGRCIQDTALSVALQTFGVGLVVLPAVCGAMAPILPVETKKQRARDRHSIEAVLAAQNLSSRLRERVLTAAAESGLRLLPPEATEPPVSGEPVDDRMSWPPPEVTLEIMVTNLSVRDDLTLARLSARIRVLRTEDRSELETRSFVHEPPGRQYWQSALEPALVELSKSITASLVWTPVPEVSPAPGSGDEPGSRTGAIAEDAKDGERLSKAMRPLERLGPDDRLSTR